MKCNMWERKEPFVFFRDPFLLNDITIWGEAEEKWMCDVCPHAYGVCCRWELLWIVFSCAGAAAAREWSEYPPFSPPPVLYWMVNNALDLPHPSAYWLMLRHSVSVETQSRFRVAYWILLSPNVFAHFSPLYLAFCEVNQRLSWLQIRHYRVSGIARKGVACY